MLGTAKIEHIYADLLIDESVPQIGPQFDADLDKLKEVFEALTDTAADGGRPKLEFDFETATVGPVNV